MSQITDTQITDLELSAYQIADLVRSHFVNWQNGHAYIPRSALRAMGRRYLVLRDLDELTEGELYEFGRLYAWFALMYAPFGDLPQVPDLAVDFCNLVNSPPPPPVEYYNSESVEGN
jgi:hypothetical protein